MLVRERRDFLRLCRETTPSSKMSFEVSVCVQCDCVKSKDSTQYNHCDKYNTVSCTWFYAVLSGELVFKSLTSSKTGYLSLSVRNVTIEIWKENFEQKCKMCFQVKREYVAIKMKGNLCEAWQSREEIGGL